MTDKIRVECRECGKKLACPATAAGKKVKCPECGAAIVVRKPKRRPAPEAAADESFDDPYGAPAEGLPQRRRKGRTSGGKRKGATSASSGNPHWSRNRLVGVGVILVTLVSSGLQTVVQGKPNLRTAAGQGQLAGQLTVLAAGVIAGIVILIRSFGGQRR